MSIVQSLRPDTRTPVATAAEAFSFHASLVAALPALRQQALALTRNAPDADDLVQAAVTNALAAKDSFTPGTNFRAWMTRILRNRFFSNLRARRETVAIDDAAPELFAAPAAQEDCLAMGALRVALGRLPADQRMILLMISVQGVSYEQAAQALGVPVGTLKCRVFRARRQLQAWLTGEDAATVARGRERRALRGKSARDDAAPTISRERVVPARVQAEEPLLQALR